jgi:hypothetical protein
MTSPNPDGARRISRQTIGATMLTSPFVALIIFGIVMLIRTDPVGAGIIFGFIAYVGIACYLLREEPKWK